MNLTAPLDVQGPVNLSGLGDIEGPVVAERPMNFENSVFTLKLVEVREPVVVRGSVNTVMQANAWGLAKNVEPASGTITQLQ